MKIRYYFVSNSSSSSWIVIDYKKEFNIPKYNDKCLVIPDNLKSPYFQFGWEITDYNSFEEKLCFCIIQASLLEGWLKTEEEIEKNTPKYQLIFQALKDILGIESFINHLTNDCESQYHAYIDHQSNALENMNLEMFEDLDTLKHFLFSPESCIHGDNDNH